ncbi:nicotinate-nucleotide--dimethylbenzimidazole phosphoribosyltransferase [Ruminococcus sp.]|uniref:nicotinate-nucleotide--dimethylbenzimidazole phosphoribosyltransferase n=1 Tax=Ruminococcus sp. TaxID=41978 RepID=UPI002C8CB099|nr:nicotinate-nucleotide--dimethylbenzimidazole phosphoribosyltransferase [Ruminococcus sp.]HNZ98695.1 nicotinate-nucleotide--dimethylbenzimidazole phosphoribosyltransferase [Ruminococcus sp.]
MERLKLIRPADRSFAAKAQEHWDGVAKPLGSFGVLEKMWDRIAAVQKTDSPDISRRAVVVMCGDNGVTAEGVTQTDSSVTLACAEAIACGRSNINALAAVYGAEVLSVDIGMKGDSSCENTITRKIAHGTGNIAAGPAMTVSQAETAIAVGMDIVKELAEKGVKLIVTGEMGIGNTTPTAALSSVILGLPPEAVTGRGAGLTTEGLRRKINAVKRAIAVNSPCDGDAVRLMAKLGSFEIAGMTGLFLGGAVYGVTVIIDGVISAVSAVLASMLAPDCKDYMLAGHVSAEPAGRMLLERLGLRAVIDGSLRLGEGTGGILLLPLLDGASALYYNSHRFESAGIERYVELK